MNTDHLDVAYAIGQDLVRTAIWHDERCNWIGPASETDAQWDGAALSALGTDLYGGTSGVAYFLAELYTATGASAIKRAALGALRQALASATTDDRCGPGMYIGSTGIAVAAAYAGMRLDQPWLVEQAARLIQQPATADPDGDREADLMSGLAGQILSLLILSDVLARTDLVEQAILLADRLLATVVKAEDWYCWAPSTGPSTSPLAGISHGTAGIGQALLELSRSTGEARYRHAGERAFAYERHLFDPVHQNWPDLRQVPKRASRRAVPFISTWCHGAPGIAMTRLRAYELFADEACRDEALQGIATTSRMLRDTLTTRTGNYSLCHGLGGNAELLLHAQEILDEPSAAQAALLQEVAEAGREHHSHPSQPWPCGIREGSTPGLMCGLAGIGLFYLRLHDPAVPSVLLLKPGAFARTANRAGSTGLPVSG
ncbi:hypothetical protein Rhe02_73000 [Rhizocola hellebori]|uniref:Uncharacterized protein n=1 Tax=Rhizocola hellebori TaxID=1392758 RepID=A0A8J3QGY3_9ACTN|nr:lanthionine synthetase LanC family protein [Rhizocola hellebori]GIH09233.1 hypothetical protein Rhe02_73000 [Rhizocola hellebori]